MPTWETYITAALTEETDRYAAGPADVFGSDLDCATDITSTARELADDDPLVVSQACYRRLTTPRDGLVDDREYGLDLRAYLHRGLTASRLRSVEAQIKSELTKDERVDAVQVTVDQDDAETCSVTIAGETAEGPFSLVLELTDGDALIKEMG